jgi:hypothetical protein
MMQQKGLVAVGCIAVLLAGILIYFGMTLPGVQSVSDSSSETADSSLGTNSYPNPSDGRTVDKNARLVLPEQADRVHKRARTNWNSSSRPGKKQRISYWIKVAG